MRPQKQSTLKYPWVPVASVISEMRYQKCICSMFDTAECVRAVAGSEDREASAGASTCDLSQGQGMDRPPGSFLGDIICQAQ
jgi:hypothetical protein